MTQENRLLEQRALGDVRALVEKLEQDQRRHRKWQVPLALAVVLPGVIWFIFLARNAGSPSPSDVQARLHACVLDAWAARSGDLTRELQRQNPDLPYSVIQKMLERERPGVMALAKVDCNDRAK